MHGHNALTARQRMRTLDACLFHLEDANERGQLVVDEALAHELDGQVGDVRPGMSIARAIDLVLAEQARCLASQKNEALVRADRADQAGGPELLARLRGGPMPYGELAAALSEPQALVLKRLVRAGMVTFQEQPVTAVQGSGQP